MVSSPLYWVLSLGGMTIFWLVPRFLRPFFLFLLSFFYLTTLSPYGVVALLGWALLFYYSSIIKTNSNLLYYLLTIGILCQLILFKCFPMLNRFSLTLNPELKIFSIALPIGLSYFTFKLIHYSIESRRGTLARHNLSQFLCYMFFFPIYTAGPIEQFDHFLNHQKTKWSPSQTVEGLSRIAYGLIKKFIVVDLILNVQSIFGVYSSHIIENLQSYSSPEIWALLLLTYLKLYLDFSAYSDIAIGTAQLFGFTIMENFNWPILATNIVDFWRRWHMTLAGWVQQYVYMPLLGLYRKPVLALVMSFIILGIWHELSASRICWGLCHAAAIIVFVRWSRRGGRRRELHPRTLVKLRGITLTQIFIITSMVFLVGDSDTSLLDCFSILARLFYLDIIFP